MDTQLTQGQQIDKLNAELKAARELIAEQDDQIGAADRKVNMLTSQIERCTSNSHLWEQKARSAEYAIDVLKEIIKTKAH